MTFEHCLVDEIKHLMENGRVVTVDLLDSLVEVEQCARNVFSVTLNKFDSPGLRTLKLNLAGLHSDHLRNLRGEIYARGGPAGSRAGATQAGSEWPQLRLALTSSNPESVASACARAEEKVALAYEQALQSARWEEPLHSVVARQLEAVRRAREGIGRAGSR